MNKRKTAKSEIIETLNKMEVAAAPGAMVKFDYKAKNLVIPGLAKASKVIQEGEANLEDFEFVVTNIRVVIRKKSGEG